MNKVIIIMIITIIIIIRNLKKLIKTDTNPKLCNN